MKTCTTCKIQKPKSEYHTSKRHKGGYKDICKDCCREYSRNYHKNMSPEAKERKKKNSRNNSYKRKYGITYDCYLEMCEVRNNMCDICGNVKVPAGVDDSVNKKNYLVLDHCHESMKIRGILCQTCNQGLGLLKDNIDLLTQAHIYLLETDTDKSDDREEGL